MKNFVRKFFVRKWRIHKIDSWKTGFFDDDVELGVGAGVDAETESMTGSFSKGIMAQLFVHPQQGDQMRL
jgi:hypothetical protein